MNSFDSYFDPPDLPDAPTCPAPHCDGGGNHLGTDPAGADLWECEDCGHRWTTEPQEEPEPEMDLPEEEDAMAGRACSECGGENLTDCSLCQECQAKPCRHGNPRHDCGHCEYLADLAFDSWRESR